MMISLVFDKVVENCVIIVDFSEWFDFVLSLEMGCMGF